MFKTFEIFIILGRSLSEYRKNISQVDIDGTNFNCYKISTKVTNLPILEFLM